MAPPNHDFTMSLSEAHNMLQKERTDTFYRHPAMNAAIQHALTAIEEKLARESSLPLTLAELLEIKEPTPVWVQSSETSETGWYIYHGLDNQEDDLLLFNNGNACWLTGQVEHGTISVYRHKPVTRGI